MCSSCLLNDLLSYVLYLVERYTLLTHLFTVNDYVHRRCTEASVTTVSNVHPSFSYEKKLVRELMTDGPISCTKILVRVSCTRNLDRVPSALNNSIIINEITAG